MSIHIGAKAGDIAPSILLPGDPYRARFIAETWFDDPVCFNEVRGMLGFTGTVEGKRVSVMGTGMGIPSHAIYVNELIADYGVKALIRVGTCGSMQEGLDLGNLILAMSASTDSQMNRLRFGGMDFAPTGSFDLLQKAHAAAEGAGIPVRVGNVLTSDIFYQEDPDAWKVWASYGVLAVEMETAALYTLAAKYSVDALAVLTVSDTLTTGKRATTEEREKTFSRMIDVALRALSL